MAGRCGSAVAAQTGWRVFSSQYRALTTLGIDPDRSFFPPLAWSWMIAAPLLMGVGLVSAALSALLFLASPLSRAQITPTFFLDDLPAALSTMTVISMVGKSVLMAAGMAVIAYRSGAGPKRSSQEVTDGMTRALVGSFIWLALVDLVLGLTLAG
jgi:phospholipid/cholesterol/gamma-HCH transport system permease protein